MIYPNPEYDPFTPIGSLNVPLIMDPKLVQSISSPVRLFAWSHLALGPYGTALFIDSDTEDHFGHSDHGQRLAGSQLRLRGAPESPAPTVGGSSDAILSTGDSFHTPSGMASTVYGMREFDEWARATMDEVAGRIAVGRTNGEITIFTYA